MSDSPLLHREPVHLTPVERSTVARMYSDAVMTDTSVERITYRSSGLAVTGYLAKPIAPGPWPVLIWNRGGYGERGALNDLTAFLILASTAAWGYVVLATHYRGNLGSEGSEDWGKNDIDDALNLLPVAAELPSVDMDRIGIEGASRGGMTTYRCLAATDRWRCAIIHAGVTNVRALREMRSDLSAFLRQRFGHLPNSHQDRELSLRSVVDWTDLLPRSVPILLLHGTADRTVPIDQSRELVAKLVVAGHPHTFVEIEGGGHIALRDGSYQEIDRHRRRWLATYLTGA